MPEVQEVFRMATKKVKPDPNALERQVRRQRSAARSGRARAYLAVAAVIAMIAVGALVLARRGNQTNLEPGTSVSAPPAVTLPTAAPQEHDYVNISTGVSSPLPGNIGGGKAYVVSPDGTRFAYNPCCDPPIAISVANVDGTNAHSIAGRETISSASPEEVDAYGAAWSPDGSKVVYQGRDGFTEKLGNLFIVDVRTGVRTQLTELKQILSHYWFMSPHFSPDGTSIIFNQPRGPIEDQTWDLWSVPVVGGDATIVRRNALNGSYSPDGTMITYVQSRGVWLASADGSHRRLLVTGDKAENPRWSPDGTKIAYEDSGRVYVADVASGTAVEIADGSWPEWFNDDTLIIGP